MYTNTHMHTHTHTHTHTHHTHTHHTHTHTPHTHTWRCSDRGLFSVLIICDNKNGCQHQLHTLKTWTSLQTKMNSLIPSDSELTELQSSVFLWKTQIRLRITSERSTKAITDAENGSEQENFTVNTACHTSDLNKSVHCYLDDEKQMALWVNGQTHIFTAV